MTFLNDTGYIFKKWTRYYYLKKFKLTFTSIWCIRQDKLPKFFPNLTLFALWPWPLAMTLTSNHDNHTAIQKAIYESKYMDTFPKLAAKILQEIFNNLLFSYLIKILTWLPWQRCNSKRTNLQVWHQPDS